MVELSPGATVRIVNPSEVVQAAAPGLIKSVFYNGGPPGPVGATGAQGAKGDKGDPGELTAASAPALDTTRVPDPQVKTSGGVGTPSTMTLARITTGLPTSPVTFAYGIQSTRTGTLSSVIATPYFGSLTNSDPLRIPVTPAEVITAAAYLWTDQSSARSRMDIRWYDSAGVLLSTTTGTYSNIAASTWEQRYTSATVPALAAYCVPIASVATLSGNTVVGAVAKLTGGIVVTGTVVSPTYHDGTEVGWVWSSTAHASTAKKIWASVGDYETPTGSQAKVDAHVAASNPHTQYLLTSAVPILDQNDAVDPQAKNSGGSNSAGSYTLSRITTGLPTGYLYGLETSRTGTLNSTISQMFFGAKDHASVYRWPVTPAEVITVSSMLWTDNANARARMDVQFYNSSDVIIGTTVAGTYSDIPASTWQRRTQAGITVPALAAYAYVIGTVTVRSGGGNAATSDKARMTGGILRRGNIPSPTYADGTTSGWAWVGAAHASAAAKLFLSATESSAAAGPLTLARSSADVSLTRTFDGTKTLIQNLSMTGGTNGGFNIVSTTLDGVSVHANSDDVAPIRTQLGTVGANHGYTGCVAAFTNPDGKTSADLGSEWQDSGGRRYVLLAITGGLLIMGGDYTSPGGVTTVVDVAPATDLTHVSGATHTGTINHLSITAGELLPSVQRISTTLWADDKQVTADGTVTAHEVVVRESYAILDYASIYDVAKANVGTSYAGLTVSTAVRVSNTYRWTTSGCRVTQALTELRPTTLGQCGGIQSFSLAETAGTLTRYLPGVGTISGKDWTAGVAMAAYASNLLVTTADLVSATRPPAMALDVLDNSGTVLIGFAAGYLPYGARGDEASVNATRISKAPTKLWDLRSTKKSYPTFTTAETAGWGHLQVECFRAYLDPTQVAAVLASKGDAASAWEAFNAQTNLA